ncbi:hypothetical protein T12_6030 [Trichinella patagoniensis]|uniref:Uncharacterized protein n=1 Tax=Trichinella patagoniensis TaxID=990121 RepID=A0A0V1ADC1_9BILA|nr:hypothetical protein T12_6030 [Trichinella patagoniensis]
MENVLKCNKIDIGHLYSMVAAEDMHAAYAMKPEVDDGTSAKVKEQKTNSNFPVSTEEIMDTKLSILNRPASGNEKYPNVHIDRSSSSSSSSSSR